MTTTILFARNLRNDPTEAERKLWNHLQDKKLSGYRFRRQHSIPPYIADFCCLEKKLILELDGDQHGQEAQKSYDQLRDNFLINKGFVVLRFWNHELLNNMDGVLNSILNQLENIP
jgi:very-short-patch-repair endonuclease